MESQKAWPAAGYETLPWKRDAEELALIPKSRRRKILSTYEAALVPSIASQSLDIPPAMRTRIDELCMSLVRFDERMRGVGFDLPALLLRSESSSSSQIENLTSSARNVALAELTDKAPENARLIARNILAMREMLALSDELSIEGIIEIQRVLLGGASSGLREEQVWIGGTPYSPHGAQYVPPCPERVRGCLEDLCTYANRDDVPAIVKAAIVHAQFEAIHPFIDGNGRTGRTLLHKMLRRDGILGSTTLPVSAGLLHDVDAYLTALAAYHEGEPLPVIACLCDALEVALLLGERARVDVGEVLARWEDSISERVGSAMHRLPALLVRHPVVDVSFVAVEFGITTRAVLNLVGRAEEYGILRRVGTARRGAFYQADDLIDLLNELASTSTIRKSRPN